MSGHNIQKYLFDIVEAGERIMSFVSGKDFDQYQKDILLQSGVERQFEIIGEALNQVVKIEPELSNKISNSSQIISFRNFLIHRYASVSDEVVWGVIDSYLPTLIIEAKSLMMQRDLD